MRIALIAGTDPAVYSSVILRFCQEALMFGNPWIFSTCPPSENPYVLAKDIHGSGFAGDLV
jgi:hypothetical protein